MDSEPPAFIVPLVTRAEHEALRTQVTELLDKVDHLIELTKLNAEALDWLVKAEKQEHAEAEHG